LTGAEPETTRSTHGNDDADIAALGITGAITAADKVYDGTTAGRSPAAR
jgi:hypothetical protein